MEKNIFLEIENQIGEDIEIRKVIFCWINQITKNNVKIGTRSDIISSAYNDNTIKISCHSDAPKGINVLWDILHEYGHHLDEDKSFIKKTPRELRAWEIAENLIENEDYFKENRESFLTHKFKMLLSYQFDDIIMGARFQKRSIEFINGDIIIGNIQYVSNDKTSFSFKDINNKEALFKTRDVKKVLLLNNKL